MINESNMLGLGRNSWLLAIIQPFAMAISPAIVFTSGFIGKTLAPSPQLATLPLSMMVVGVTLGTIPAAMLMKKYGRKAVFMASMLLSAASALLAAWAISAHQFILFLIAVAGVGTTLAVVQQFRFAAVEGTARPELAGRAISVLMLGSVAAAFIGTEVAAAGHHLFEADYAGSFVLLAIVSLFAFVLLAFFKNTGNPISTTTIKSQFPISAIFKRTPLLIAIAAATVGYSVMSFVMTATPLAMHDIHQHSLGSTKWVIQSHIMAMFLPSLITGELIRKFGSLTIIWIGLAAFTLTTAFAFSGAEVFHYWWALVMLGIGWNFLFIGGTTMLTQNYQPEEKFKVQAVNDFSVFIFQAIASLGAGAILFAKGWMTVVVISLIPTVILMVALLLFYIYSRKISIVQQ